jgi:hypothetical protein
MCIIWSYLPQEETEELSKEETRSKVAKFLSTEKSIVSKMTNPFIGSAGMPRAIVMCDWSTHVQAIDSPCPSLQGLKTPPLFK